MAYIQRIIEKNLSENLAASGAVLIKGPKACGKTETAKQYAKSMLEMDRDMQVPLIMSANPELLLLGDTPRLLDEWQEYPEIWNYVRHEVDKRKQKGQFILTGSANPNEDIKLHSGSGRFTTIQMETMTWQELGYSTGIVKLSELLDGCVDADYHQDSIPLDFLLDKMIIGGWPALLQSSAKNALIVNTGYVDLLCEVDMSRVSDIKRDPLKIRSLLRSIARNTGTLVDNRTLERDVYASERSAVSRNTIADYMDALSRLMILYEQPALTLIFSRQHRYENHRNGIYAIHRW
jgi:predicted AAA+ superfamily ATPase